MRQDKTHRNWGKTRQDCLVLSCVQLCSRHWYGQDKTVLSCPYQQCEQATSLHLSWLMLISPVSVIRQSHSTSRFLSGLLWSTASKTSVCRYCTAATGSLWASSSNRCRLSRYRQSCRSVPHDKRQSCHEQTHNNELCLATGYGLAQSTVPTACTEWH